MLIYEMNVVYFGTNKGNWIFLNLASLFPVINRMYFQLQIECLIIFKGISSVPNPLSRLYLALFSHTNNSFKAHWTIVFSDAYVQSSNITYYTCVEFRTLKIYIAIPVQIRMCVDENHIFITSIPQNNN